MTAPAARTRRPSWLVQGSLLVHAGAGIALAAAPDRWPLALGAVLTTHAALTTAGLLPRCSLLGPNLTRLPAGACRGRVGLTFDDGPDPDVTPAVLDLLERRGARASFFCVGQAVEAHPRLAREIHARGHRVENHSQRHSNAFAFLGPRALGREIARAQEAISGAVGRAPVLFRAPAGIRNPWLDPVLAGAGLRLASWTRRGFDTVSRDAGRVSARLVGRLAEGDILLLHDGRGSRDGSGRRIVLDVLPRVLDALEAARLVSVPLDETLAAVAG